MNMQTIQFHQKIYDLFDDTTKLTLLAYNSKTSTDGLFLLLGTSSRRAGYWHDSFQFDERSV